MTRDLRLAPTVLAAWTGAWLLTAPSGRAVTPVLLAAAALALGCALLVCRRGARAAVCHLLLGAVCLVGVGLSVHVQLAARGPVAELAEAQAAARLTGTVVSQPRPAQHGGHRWVLAVTEVGARGSAVTARAHVEVRAPGPPPRVGAAVTVPGRLGPPAFRAGTVAVHAATGTVVEDRPPAAALRTTDTLRQGLLDLTEGLSPQARGLVPGTTVGDTTRLPEDLDTAMKTTSLTHVTAVSGSHFSIVLAAVTALAMVLRLPVAVRVLVLALAAVGFVLLVRPEPSVLRASWTCAVGLLALVLGRPAAGPPALAVAATVLLLVDPWQSRSYAFALSCSATAGIVLLTGPLARRLAPWTGRPLAFGLAVPLAAQAACGPVLVLIDPAVPLTAVPANLLATPALVPATVLGLVALLLAGWAPAVAAVVAGGASLATGWIAGVATVFSSLPGARLPWWQGSAGALALAVVTLVLLVLVLRRPPGQGWPRSWREAGVRRARRVRGTARRAARRAVLTGAAAAVVLAVVVAVIVGGRPGGLPADWEVVACDVGQGDALVVRSGARSAVVVDVGPPGDAAARCLDRLGVREIDLLVLTHFHTDHVGGLEDALAGRGVGRVLVSPLDAPAAPAARTHEGLRSAGVAAEVPAAGWQGQAGDVSWLVLGARAAGGSASEEGDGANDASVVVALRTAGGLEVVALGDLEEAGQELLLRDLRRAGYPDGPTSVVKMAHHGSRSQSAGLAELLAPMVTLVSVGENSYGHPTEAALDLYAATGTRLVRTDECGDAVLTVRDDRVGLWCGR